VRKDATDKVCYWCHTSHTPEWRLGEEGEPLCNACGLQFKKYKKQLKMKQSLEKVAIKNLLNYEVDRSIGFSIGDCSTTL
jgi:hypothetical protein